MLAGPAGGWMTSEESSKYGRVAMVFINRVDAGRQLAGRLTHLRGQDVVVLGLPRGGVPVAAEVAEALAAPLDVIVVRKLGVPDQPELAMGAIGEGGVRVVNPDVMRMARVDDASLAAVEAAEHRTLDQQVRRFRGGRPATSLAGRTALIIDDGVATGSTARAACQVARAQGARRVILAAPVAAEDTVPFLRRDADEVVCVMTPAQLWAVGQWYDDFGPTSDEEVRDLLARYGSGTRVGADPPVRAAEVIVRAGRVDLPGDVTLPPDADAIVVFAHGSGSSRRSPRNRFVASVLNQAGLGTLLFDLLTPAEDNDRVNVFDIGLLAGRLAMATAWLHRQPWAVDARIGWFGASTGAAAALWAAAALDADVAAIVSRSGRPDLAGDRLAAVRAPTLLIVGGLDTTVIGLNRGAQARLRCPSRLDVVPGATHLFEEPGTLEAAAGLARDWFGYYLRPLAGVGRAGRRERQ
jgi:predicted phosphoribosyltransferase/predicted alpha/beta-hydrolase family hydrolase